MHISPRRIRWLFARSSPLLAVRIGVGISVVFAIVGIFLGATRDSLAVEINGLITAIDVVNSLLFLTALRQSVKSADTQFNYGYGKYESLGVLSSSLLLSLVLGYFLLEVVLRMLSPEPVLPNTEHFTLLLFSSFAAAILIGMARWQRANARRFGMPMLDYDADVWRVDSYMELGVVANLVLGWVLSLAGWSSVATFIDAITAVLLLIYALYVPLKHSKEAIDQLLDKTLPEEVKLFIIGVVAEHISQICEYRALHTRRSGKDIFIELDVVLPYDHNLEQAFEVESSMRAAILQRYPNAVVRLYAVPCSHDCELSGTRFCPAHLHR